MKRVIITADPGVCFFNNAFGFILFFKTGSWRYLDFHPIPVQWLTDQTVTDAQAGWPLLDTHLILSKLLCTCREQFITPILT